MSNQYQQEQNNTPFTMDEVAKENILSTATIANRLGIITLAGAVLGMIGYFVKGNTAAPAPKEGFDDKTAQLVSSSNSVSVIASLAMGIVIFYLLNNFARQAKTAFANGDEKKMEQGLGSLAGYFKLAAIILLIAIVFMMLAVLMTGLGGAVK